MPNTSRIRFIDGFRGLAILLVILFHAFSRWSDLVPYGSQFKNFPLFSNGWVGIQLFFLISGFVILMTLEKCKTLGVFLYKRWLRLFPGMLLATILIFFTAGLFWERPAGMPKIQDVVPGITFIEPYWIEKVSGIKMANLEGAFWSLYAEVKFYIIFGSLYFLIGREKAIAGISALFLSVPSAVLLAQITNLSIFDSLDTLLENLSFHHFGWFAVGALIYIYYMEKNKKALACSLIIGSISVIWTALENDNPKLGLLFGSVILFLFITAFIIKPIQTVFDNRVLNFVGFVSYPLYLIHENMMISIIIKLGKMFSFIPMFLLPVISISFVICIAYIIAKYGEPFIRSILAKMPVSLRILSKNTSNKMNF